MTSPAAPSPTPVQPLRKIPIAHYALYALIALGCALRIYNVVAYNPLTHLWSDPLRHWAHASEPLMPSPMALFDPPFFQMWLSLIQKFTMGLTPLIAAYACTLSVVAPWCWYKLLRETIDSKTIALAGWAALALLPTWVGIYSYFMTETLLIPLIGLSLWMTRRAQRKATMGAFLAMVAVWLITGLTRGITIPLAGIACLIVWYGHPQKIKTAFYSVLILGSVLTPLAIRNHNFMYLWEPYGNGWIARIYGESGRREIALHLERNGSRWEYGFTSPMMDERPFAPFSDWKSSRTGIVHVSVDLTHGSLDWQKALEQSRQQGAARWPLRLENCIFLFQGNSWPDNDPATLMGRLTVMTRWIWIPLFLAVVIVSTWKWRCCVEKPLLPLLIVIWFVFQAWMLTSVNEGRYRKPVEGLLIAQACVLVDHCIRNSKKRPTAPTEPTA